MRFIDLQLFLLLFACVAGALVYESPIRFRTLVETRDPWDVAIVGQGYFQVIDSNAGNICYTRTGIIRINHDGFLCLLVGGKEWSTEPQICVPNDWSNFYISGDGEVSVHDQISNTTSLRGKFQLARFQTILAFSDDFAVNNSSDQTGQVTRGG